MRRRDFITLLGGAAAAWPLVARAQQVATPKIGWLSSASPENLVAVPFFQAGAGRCRVCAGRDLLIEYGTMIPAPLSVAAIGSVR